MWHIEHGDNSKHPEIMRARNGAGPYETEPVRYVMPTEAGEKMRTARGWGSGKVLELGVAD